MEAIAVYGSVTKTRGNKTDLKQKMLKIEPQNKAKKRNGKNLGNVRNMSQRDNHVVVVIVVVVIVVLVVVVGITGKKLVMLERKFSD